MSHQTTVAAPESFTTFGDLLVYLRKRARLTQAELGRAVGYGRTQITMLEKNQRLPAATTVAALFLPALDLDEVPQLAQRLVDLAASAQRPRTNLPMALTSFIGRDEEVAELRRLITAQRIVTLTGSGGVGKTRLALESAAGLVDTFADGIWLIEFAPLNDATLVPHAVAAALGLQEASGRPVVTALIDVLRDKQRLLILDNCEHLVEACAQLVATLLHACPRLKIIVTSRESLRVPGEWLYAVPPLRVPADAQLKTLTAGALDQFSALNLFAERARAVRSEFALTLENTPSVAAICRQLDGLPLAIELIASRIRLMSPPSLLAQLTSDFALHADGVRGVPSRQKTLHHTIVWSYDLLSRDEQILLARLSVFAGRFTLEAAQAVVQLPGVINSVMSLLDKSLLIRTIDAQGETRFNQLEMIREFARDRLREADEETTLGDRHAAYFLALAEKANQVIRGPQQTTWLRSLELVHADLLTSLTWLLDCDRAECEAGLRLAGVLGDFWYICGYWTEGLHWLDRALAKAGDNFGSLRAKLLLAIGPILLRRGEIEQAVNYLQESLTLHEQSGDTRGMARVLEWLGVAAETQGNLQQEIALYEQSLALFQSANDKPGMASLLVRMGYIAQRENDLERATRLLEQGLALSQAAGDKLSSASAFRYLGWIAVAKTNLAQAAKFFQSCLTLARELNAKNAIAGVLIDQGELARVQSDYAEAAKCYEESLLISRELGSRSMIRILLHNLGHVALHQQDPWQARLLFEEALTEDREVEDEDSIIALCLRGLGGIASTRGEFERAARLFGAAEVLLGTERMYPADLVEYNHHLAGVRDHLEASTLESLLAEGRALTLEQAIEFALQT